MQHTLTTFVLVFLFLIIYIPKNIGACEKVRAHRKGLPQEMKTIKANKAKLGTLPKIWL